MELQFLNEPELIFEAEKSNTYIYKCTPMDYPKQQPYILKCIQHNEKKPNKCVKQCKLLENEYKYSQKFISNSQNILQQKQYQQNTLFNKVNCCIVTMEFAEIGDFFSASKGQDKQIHQNLQKIENFKKIFLQCAKSLKLVHDQNISHNDIKEDNFFLHALDFENDDLLIKLGDFGFAFEGQRTIQQQFNLYRGKNICTLSPEQVDIVNKVRKEAVDEKISDIYCLGVVMLETLLRINFSQIQEDYKLQQWINEGAVGKFQCKFSKYFKQLKEINCDNKQATNDLLKTVFSTLKETPEERIDLNDLISQLEQNNTGTLA